MNDYQNKELDIFDFFKILKINLPKIVLVTSIFILIFSFFAFFQENKYESYALLKVTDDLDGNSSVPPSSISNIANLAGLSIPQSSSEKKAAFGLEILNSRSFITEFIKKYDLAPMLYAVEGFDKDKIIYNKSVYVRDKNQWKKNPPTSEELYKIMTKMMSVEINSKTGFITLSINHISPYVAKNIVDLLVIEINDTQRKYELSKANKAIDYLSIQSTETSLISLRSVFNSIIESQIRKKMLADISDEFYFTTIDPAFVAIKPSSPNRLLIILFGMLLGFIISLTYILIVAIKDSKH